MESRLCEKKIKADKIANGKIYSQKAIDNSKKSEPKTISFSGTSNAKPKNENIDLFLSRISKPECKPAILHSYSEHCDTFIPKFKPPERTRLANMMQSYSSSMHKEQIKVKCNEILLKLKLKQQDIDYVESLTRKQSNCLIWHHVRCRHINASKVYDVLQTDINNPSTSLIESICKESTITNTNIPALKWGIDNEKNAITQYIEFLRNQGHQNFKLNNCGMFLCRENSFLGVT